MWFNSELQTRMRSAGETHRVQSFARTSSKASAARKLAGVLDVSSDFFFETDNEESVRWQAKAEVPGASRPARFAAVSFGGWLGSLSCECVAIVASVVLVPFVFSLVSAGPQPSWKLELCDCRWILALVPLEDSR